MRPWPDPLEGQGNDRPRWGARRFGPVPLARPRNIWLAGLMGSLGSRGGSRCPVLSLCFATELKATASEGYGITAEPTAGA